MANNFGMMAGLAGLGIGAYVAYQQGWLDSLGTKPPENGGDSGDTGNGGTDGQTQVYHDLEINVFDKDDNRIEANVSVKNTQTNQEQSKKSSTTSPATFTNIAEGNYEVAVSKKEYAGITQEIVLNDDRVFGVELQKTEEADKGNIEVTAFYETNGGGIVQDAKISIPELEITNRYTNDRGKVKIEKLPVGEYKIVAEKEGWTANYITITVKKGTTVTGSIPMETVEESGEGGGTLPPEPPGPLPPEKGGPTPT